MRCLFAITLGLVAFFLVRPALAGTTHCTTYQEKTLGRLQTLCADGTRAISTSNRTLERWERTVTSPPGQTCTGQLNPRTRQVEVTCREEDCTTSRGRVISRVVAGADLRTFPTRG